MTKKKNSLKAGILEKKKAGILEKEKQPEGWDPGKKEGWDPGKKEGWDPGGKEKEVFVLKIKSGIFVFACLCCLFVTGITYSQPSRYRFQQMDVLSISVHGHPDLSAKTRLTSEGYISFPLVGKVSAKGLTIRELEEKLEKLLEEKYLVNAQVLIFIEEYHPRQVSLVGEVNKPGKYNMPEEKDMPLLEAVALAEGFTKDANIRNIKIMRVENGAQVVIKTDAKKIMFNGQKDVVLKADDVIVVSESFF
jgi:protein involved in polysaccharide export with SLBB domain